MGERTNSKLKLGIVGLDHWMGGVIYTHNLIRSLNLLSELERPHLTLFCNKTTSAFDETRHLVNDEVRYAPILSNVPSSNRIANFAKWVKAGVSVLAFREAQPELAFAVRKAKVDAVFSISNPYSSMIPNAIAWIPDLQHCSLPELFSKLEIKGRDHKYKSLMQQPGRHIVFSSEHTRAEAIRYYGQSKAKLHVVHFATVPDTSWADDPADIINKYNLPSKYLVVPNQFWKHKDHETLFRAVALLKEQGLTVNLVCTGGTEDYRHPQHYSDLVALIRGARLEEQIHILGVVPRYEQIMIIRGALAIIQPSLFEGWSTVLEDARVLRKRVIASDFPVHLEQNLPESTYFRRKDVTDCARAVAAIYKDSEGGKEVSEFKFQPSCYEPALKFARDILNVVTQVSQKKVGSKKKYD
jgi:glycosyltransferase involved in cell wall biosynthesis